IDTEHTAGQVGAVQLRECLAQLPAGLRPLLTGDRYYANAPFLRATADLACAKLLRTKSRRVFYRPAPPHTGKPGAACKDGARFAKQALLWDQPRLRTPEQFERWTQIVAIVHDLLVLARPLIQAKRQPWERSSRPVTPQQLRRAMAPILATLGTPARPPQPRG